VHSGDDSERGAKGNLARELNQQVREIGRTLTEPDDASEELTFFCECGCLQPVRLTLEVFDAAPGALREGHSRPEDRS
jgi:hypothetical protein